MSPPQRPERVASALAYLLVLVGLHELFIEDIFPLGLKEFWLFSGISSLILGSRLLNPHFTPPADSAINAFVAGSAALAIFSSADYKQADYWLLMALIGFCLALFVAAMVLLVIQRERGAEGRKLVLISERVVRGLGDPTVIFTGLVVAAAWLYHRASPTEIFVILTSWTVIVALAPIERALSFWRFASGIGRREPAAIVGQVVAYQTPGLSLIRQANDQRLERGTPLLLGDDKGPTQLGIVVNYVGRDEGLLLRTLNLPVPHGLRQRAEAQKPAPRHAVLLTQDGTSRIEIALEYSLERLRGIVDSETTLEHLRFEVIEEGGLQEGALLEVNIGSEKVTYQVIDAVTREESVQEKNKYGYSRGLARKIGKWDTETQRFIRVPWLPRLNAPVFICEEDDGEITEGAIGRFPDYKLQYFGKRI